jgi:hypothetical protein
MNAMRLLVSAVLLVGASCAKKKHDAAPEETVTPMSVDEVKRSEDACKAYVERACTCPAAAQQCKLAKAQPDAVRIALEVAANPESKPDVVRQSYASVRKTVKECIEQMAKLPSLGCP